jgi:L-lysine 6-oxidase
MATRYEIHPKIGIARVGDSPDDFYLAPEAIGGLPLECDGLGNALTTDGGPRYVERFKDAAGRVRRQAARLKVLAYDDDAPDQAGREVTLQSPEVAAIEWTVHLANKKGAWYQFQELQGNLLLGPDNSYQAQGVPLRNASVQGDQARQQLIIDPGPRQIGGAQQRVSISRDNIPPGYSHGSFPPPDLKPYPIDSLGDLLTDAEGRLLVLGGFGRAGGSTPITSFAGADTWHDDVSDGPVTCRLTLAAGGVVELRAWAVVGSPKFAPELVNIVTWDDLAFDVGVRSLGLVPDLYDGRRWPGGWNPDYVANYRQDVEPIIARPAGYRWVANVPSMIAFSPPPFDPTDASEGNRARRETFYRYFRRPDGFATPGQDDVLFSADGVPLMPLNSGSNSVSNVDIDKFSTLTPTQYYLLGQWAQGKFTTAPGAPTPGVSALDRASVGNCVGDPMCPGIEVTWSVRNPAIYDGAFRIRSAQAESYYFEHGLSPSRDETTGGGCEPGDLTKRMAIPWQADFFDCSIQYINFIDPKVNKDNGIPVPPTYFAYWWPPQSPMYVISGAMTVAEQAVSGVQAGFQVYYPRGVNNFSQMIVAWKYMGFIVNQTTGAQRDDYPYFVERERNHDRFEAASVAVGDPSNVISAEDITFMPVWYLKEQEAPSQRRLLRVRRQLGH